jgi:hypothetical protein
MNKWWLIVCALFFNQSSVYAKSERDFIKSFMDTLVLIGQERESDIEAMKYISKEFLAKYNIDVFSVRMNSWDNLGYEIIDFKSPYVVVNVNEKSCIKAKYCWGKHILYIKVMPQQHGYAIEPHSYNESSNFLDFWWQSIEGKYPLP